MKRIVSFVFAALMFVAFASAQAASEAPAAARGPRLAWSQETIAAMESLPLQDGGRVKPFAALAASTLHLVHGRRDMKLDTDGDGKDDVTLTPTEWLLDVWCFPDRAADYPLFRIENYEVLDALGIEYGAKKNFEYVSYRRLGVANKDGKRPGDVLFELAMRFAKKSAKERSGIEAHLVNSAEQVRTYNSLHQYLLPLASPYRIEGAEFQKRFGGKTELWLGELAGQGDALRAMLQEFDQKRSDPAIGNLFTIAAHVSETIDGDSGLPALFPPNGTRADDEHWLGLGGVVGSAIFGRITPEQSTMLDHLEQALGTDDHAVRQRSLVAFRDAVVARASARGEFGKVELEATYLAKSYHYQALHWFLAALLVVGAGWFAPRAKWLWWAGIAATVWPLALLVTDIVLRCIIRSRPPILNLYDTFLFIAAVGVSAAVVAEIIMKRRVVISIAPIFGAMLVMLARAFEVEDGKDQMAPLQAVLDTNYYLATHVTSINMGYAAGMFASFVATAWLAMQALGIAREDRDLHKAVVRSVYGLTAFGLIFAVFGTIYGGVWANDSWGRFWGWDPKENGALMIVLWNALVLHARWDRLIGDRGLAILAVFGNIVTAWSWFGVNELGVGLHSYGFTEGRLKMLGIAILIHFLIMLAGIVSVQLMPFITGSNEPREKQAPA